MILIGEPLDRVDGWAKLTGYARYSAEFAIPNLVYGVIVQSSIANGQIESMDTAEASKAPGVIAVITPFNAPKLKGAEKRLSLLQDAQVHYNGQPIAVVVAETLQQAAFAASSIRVRYQPAAAKLDFEAGFPTSYTYHHNDEPGDLNWGDVEAGLRQAEVRLEQVYTTPIQYHNPMEPHATIAAWENGRLTVHDATQNISGVKETLARIFDLNAESVHVISLLIGGGFGCKGQVWSHVPLAAMAAKQLNRPVKIVMERPQMFGPVGARPRTHQQITLAATRAGKLTAMRHDVHAHTSVIEDYLENSAALTRTLYACANGSTMHRVVPLNLGTPTYMRAPGVATGSYALEVAMDELSYQLGMDPLQLRLVNYAETDPHNGKPFTSKHLRECYQQAGERFGWSKRNRQPRSMSDGRLLIGWGMATETYPARSMPASASVRLEPSGRVVVASGTHEIGTGTYTIVAQVAGDVLNMPMQQIDVKLGDTDLPQAPISAGSMTVASVTPAVREAALQARQQLLQMAASDPASPVHGSDPGQIEFEQGMIFRTDKPGARESYSDLLARHGSQPVQATVHNTPDKEVDEQFSPNSFGAVFAEVAVDPPLGIVRVRRVVAVYDVGALMNEKTAHSQFIGGIVWGISLALLEDTYVDSRNGRVVTASLEKYHVPVNADIGEIDVSALNIPDPKVDALGARGIGEIGITGTGAAVANAVYHATGKRIRDLPISPDKLISSD